MLLLPGCDQIAGAGASVGKPVGSRRRRSAGWVSASGGDPEGEGACGSGSIRDC